MHVTEQALAGVHLLQADPQYDERGYFARVFDVCAFERAGLETSFPQRAIASNERAGTIRGLHFATAPHTEAKIVTCLRGAIFDVVLDLREGSPTFGRWASFALDDARLESLYVPRGFAHGYQTLQDHTLVAYDLSMPYVASAASGIHHADPQLAIDWPQPVSTISKRDAGLGTLADMRASQRRAEPAITTTLRSPGDADFDVLRTIRNDPSTQYALLANPTHNSDEDVRRWIERRITDPAALFFVIADSSDTAVGFAQIVSIDARSRHGFFGIAIDPRKRNTGYGRAALASILAEATRSGRLDKIALHVAADNPAARLYAEAGFRTVGTHIRHYRGPDRWHDVLVMERFLSDPPAAGVIA